MTVPQVEFFIGRVILASFDIANLSRFRKHNSGLMYGVKLCIDKVLLLLPLGLKYDTQLEKHNFAYLQFSAVF